MSSHPGYAGDLGTGPWSGSKVSSDQQPHATDFYPAIVVKEPRSYASDEAPKEQRPRKLPTRSPDSPFYMPPPSSKALRWSIVLCPIGPFLLAFSAFEFALAHQWAGLVFALVMLCVYSLLEWFPIRAILRALARRRAGESPIGRSR